MPTAATVEVFHRHRRVASHVRQFSPGYSTDPAHMPESHRRHASWTPSRIIAWAANTGPSTAKLAEAIMTARRHPEQGFRSWLGIVRLGDRYGTVTFPPMSATGSPVVAVRCVVADHCRRTDRRRNTNGTWRTLAPIDRGRRVGVDRG